jgi:hypothetical protein
LPPRPESPSFVFQLSRFLNEGLRTDALAGLGGRLAGRVGFDETNARHGIQSGLQSAGEAGIKKALESIIYGVFGQPTAPPANQFGPALQPLDLHETIIKGPSIPF